MYKITEPKEAYRWLRAEAEATTEQWNASYFLMGIYKVANRRFDSGLSMPGLELEAWTPLMEGVAGEPVLLEREWIARPVAEFVGNLLADLAARGDAGEISVEQAVIMLIDVLRWRKDFMFKSAANHLPAIIKTRRQFEKVSGVSMLITIDPSQTEDLSFHF